MKLKKTTAFKISVILALSSVLIYTTQCQKNFDLKSYSPSSLPQANIKTVSVNNGGAFYCSISGGCPVTLTGDNFFINSKVFIGPYECLNSVSAADFKSITCTVGPGQNGVYNFSVVNPDGQSSKLDASVTNPTALQFSYASFLYIGSTDGTFSVPASGKVYAYAQHPTDGSLITITGSPFTIGTEFGTYGVAIGPNNKFLYAANTSSGTVSVFAIDPTNGKLTASGTPISSGGAVPNGLFFHPSGNFLYVTNQGGNSVTGFKVAVNGSLSLIAGSPFPTTGATSINGVVISANGQFLYAAAGGGNGGVSAFTIDPLTGVLTTITGSPFINTLGGVTTNPGDGISIHPNGKWLYMGLFGIRKTSVWTINQMTGALTAVEPPILNNATTGYVDNRGSASTVSADGLFFYGTAFSSVSTDPKKIIIYSIDPLTGGLTRSSEATTGGGPNDIRLDTTGFFAYTCNTENPPSISAFSVNKTTGALTALAVPNYSIPAPAMGPGIMVMQRNK